MKKKLFNFFKNLGVFIFTMVIFTICSSILPEQPVEVTYSKYSEIEKQEKKIFDEYNVLNIEFEKKKSELLEKKQAISSDNEKIIQQIDDLKKEIKELSGK